MGALVTTARAVAWVAAAVILAAPLASPGGPLSRVSHAAGPLTITGDVAGLVPGVASPLVLTIVNDAAEPVLISSLDVAVSGGGPGCGPSGLSVPSWTGRLIVPAGGQVQQSLSAVVAADEACAGTSWDLGFTAV